MSKRKRGRRRTHQAAAPTAIQEAVQREYQIKGFEDAIQIDKLPDGPFSLLIKNTSPVSPYYAKIATSLAKLGRKDVLVVVVNDFDDLGIFDRDDMRPAGWAWVGEPRSDEIDGPYWDNLEEIQGRVQTRTGKNFSPADIAAFLAAYRFQLEEDHRKLQKSWQRAQSVHPDLASWSVPVDKLPAWRAALVRFWLGLVARWRK